MQTDSEVAAKLTKVQRRILCAMPTDGAFVDGYKYCRQRQTRVILTNAGIVEPEQNGEGTVWWRIRLSGLGIRVAQHLKENAK